MLEIAAPMSGKVLEVKVSAGDKVEEGQEVIIMEAMKMELPIIAERSGIVTETRCKPGDQVESGDVLMILKVQ